LKLYRIFLQIFCIPVFLSDFLDRSTGKEHSVSVWRKLSLIFKMIRNNRKIISGSTFIEHIAIATTILRIPKDTEGVVVECGTYKGVSAANLSLVCAFVNRKLEIFDSFEGLPTPSRQDAVHTLLSRREIHTYERGAWNGTLDEVKNNIQKYGRPDVCYFNKGFFDQTLPNFKQKAILVWVDVDYRSSLETCVKYLWPLLQDGGYFFTHEVEHSEIASLFFSESWWRENLNTAPPGMIGAGTGLGFKILTGSHFSSSLGYTIKNPNKQAFAEVPQIGGMKVNLSSSFKLTSCEKGRS